MNNDNRIHVLIYFFYKKSGSVNKCDIECEIGSVNKCDIEVGEMKQYSFTLDFCNVNSVKIKIHCTVKTFHKYFRCKFDFQARNSTEYLLLEIFQD